MWRESAHPHEAFSGLHLANRCRVFRGRQQSKHSLPSPAASKREEQTQELATGLETVRGAKHSSQNRRVFRLDWLRSNPRTIPHVYRFAGWHVPLPSLALSISHLAIARPASLPSPLLRTPLRVMAGCAAQFDATHSRQKNYSSIVKMRQVGQ